MPPDAAPAPVGSPAASPNLALAVPMGIETGSVALRALKAKHRAEASPVALATEMGRTVAADPKPTPPPPPERQDPAPDDGQAPEAPAGDPPPDPAPDGDDAGDDDYEVDLGEGKKVRLAELVEAHRARAELEAKVADADKGAEELSQRRQQADAEAEQLRRYWEQSQHITTQAQQAAQAYSDGLKVFQSRLQAEAQQFQGWDYQRERQEDPIAAADKMARWHDLQARWGAFQAETRQLEQERAQLAHQELAARRQRCDLELPRVVPEWTDRGKLTADLPAMNQIGAACGFSDEELKYTTDPRVYKLLKLAAEGARLKAEVDKGMAAVRGGGAKAAPAPAPADQPGRVKVLSPRGGGSARGNPVNSQAGRVGAATQAFSQNPSLTNAAQLLRQSRVLKAMNGR